eukprot:366417-Chlamydomonas_euryale.AAC.29
MEQIRQILCLSLYHGARRNRESVEVVRVRVRVTGSGPKKCRKTEGIKQRAQAGRCHQESTTAHWDCGRLNAVSMRTTFLKGQGYSTLMPRRQHVGNDVNKTEGGSLCFEHRVGNRLMDGAEGNQAC